MNKISKLVWIAIALAALVLAAGCNLKASSSPTPKPEATSETDFLTPTTDTTMNEIMTSTAEAQKPAVATATPTPAAEATTAPEATKAPEPTKAAVNAEATATPVSSSSSSSSSVAIPTLTRPSSYTIQKGEYPFCIARRFDLDVSSLLSINGLGSNSRVSAGTVLKIPSSGNWNTASGSRALHKHTDYTVKSGDTIYTIACYFGDVSPEAIRAANGMGSDEDVKSGTTLKIP